MDSNYEKTMGVFGTAYSDVVAKRIQQSRQMPCGCDDSSDRTRTRNRENELAPTFPIRWIDAGGTYTDYCTIQSTTAVPNTPNVPSKAENGTHCLPPSEWAEHCHFTASFSGLGKKSTTCLFQNSRKLHAQIIKLGRT